MGRAFTFAAGTVIVLMLIKDGSFGKLVDNGSSFVKNFATGIKPVTTIT